MKKETLLRVVWLAAILTIFYAVFIQNFWLSAAAIVAAGVLSYYVRGKK